MANGFGRMLQSGWNKFTNSIKGFWNGLTGQTQEDVRTQAVNESNERATESTNAANRDIASDTNATNLQIAKENLDYQRDLQEYNKALQERIFEREDTSYQRTADDMLKAGLNPLTMQGTNGAGEAIAMAPLNNSFQAQIGTPMQSPQFQKSQTMMSPIQALSNFTNVLGTVINSIESIKTGSVQRDSLRKQTDQNSIRMFLDSIDKGVLYNSDSGKIELDEDTFNKYLEQKAKEKDYNISKMKHDMREWEHFEKTGKFESDTNFEKILTAVEDWLTSGRSESMWNKLKNKYPLLKLVDSWAKELISDQPYDSEVKYSNGQTHYYKNGVEVDKKGNKINK